MKFDISGISTMFISLKLEVETENSTENGAFVQSINKVGSTVKPLLHSPLKSKSGSIKC